jgi:chaperonin cofactor prefoldin
MKVRKEGRGEHDLELRIERLELRVRDLKEINEKHQRLNGKLRKELKDVREALARVSGPVH